MFPTDKAERKKHPIFSGVLRYFPRTIVALAKCSWVGNDQHNPGEPLHWAREKSNDHEDCLIRHLMAGDTLDDDEMYHCVKVAWRALARAELILDKAAKQEVWEEIDQRKEGLDWRKKAHAGMPGTPPPPPPPETRVDPDHGDMMWNGAKIGYTINSQSLFKCPHCGIVSSQPANRELCDKCGESIV